MISTVCTSLGIRRIVVSQFKLISYCCNLFHTSHSHFSRIFGINVNHTTCLSLFTYNISSNCHSQNDSQVERKHQKKFVFSGSVKVLLLLLSNQKRFNMHLVSTLEQKDRKRKLPTEWTIVPADFCCVESQMEQIQNYAVVKTRLP